MKPYLFLISVLLVAGCAKQEPVVQKLSSPIKKIEGLVYESGAKNSIPGVPVIAYDKYGYLVNGATTNIRGGYAISDILPGMYILRIHSGEYATGGKYVGEYYKNVYNWEDANVVIVKENSVTSEINFLLDKGAVIKGKLIEKNSKTPIPNNPFFLKLYKSKNTYVDYVSQTDSIGEYTVSGLEPGKYHVFMEPEGWIGTSHSDTLITINIILDTIKGVNFEVKKGGTICGKVTPVAQTWIQVIGNNKSVEKQVDSAGNYVISGLPADNYMVKVKPLPKVSQYAWKYWKDTNNPLIATYITVKEEDTVKNIDFQLKQEGIISGTVKDKNNIPLENYDFEIYDTRWNKVEGSEISHGSNGYYEIHNLPQGEYILKINAFVPYLNKAYYGKYYKNTYKPENVQKIAVTSGSITINVNFKLEPAGIIQGFVFCNANLLSGDSTRFYIIAFNTKTGETFSSKNTFTGGYKILGLPVGEYKVCAFAPGTEFSAIWLGGGTTFNDNKTELIKITGVTPVDFNFSVAPRKSKVSVKVYDEKTKNPIFGGKVIAYDLSGHIVQIAEYTPEGHTLTGLPAGKYFIKTADFKNYKDKWYKNKEISASSNSPILWSTTIPPNTTYLEIPALSGDNKDGTTLTGTVDFGLNKVNDKN
ncbi:MAG: carboxypeptidase-like regulatory domain-containing protein [bacterium]|nr:carboxypeptidase-like regulatory domain-containing protein [bacterium]